MDSLRKKFIAQSEKPVVDMNNTEYLFNYVRFLEMEIERLQEELEGCGCE